MAATELAVIGAGPAGVAAAVAAADLGVKVTLIDELPGPGGQYLTDHHASAVHPPVANAERRGLDLLRRLADSPVALRTETVVWSLLADHTLALYRRGEVEQLTAQAVVIATGARELAVPFPGWTLPGVMTVGAAQLLAKRGVLPGHRVLLAGSGPLLLPAACKLAELGAEVVGILEVTRPPAWLRHAPALWGNWDRLGEGAYYLGQLRRARIRYRFGYTPVRALGRDQLEAAVIARLDAQGCPIPGSEETLPVDTLCVGFGFAPNIELAQLAGCRLQFAPTRGGWTPHLDNQMQTTVPGIFSAGETAGVAGAAAALIEGRIAGLAVACRLGRLAEADLAAEVATLHGKLRPMRRFGAMLNTLFVPPAGLSVLTTDDTPICRCEEVTAGEVRAAVAQGAVTLDALKAWTRVGQGPCQGRTCGPILARLIAGWTGGSSADAGLFHVRPPVKPVPIASLAKGWAA
ncbi:MAG: NAD(P)/FAD-dependent oxidoreductase [Chloroflexi bacterium]|nr:NAD(P)/FAD-dependent oxidoreductase [Chloroflexota bacterium]